jgi:hypothetical protein
MINTAKQLYDDISKHLKPNTKRPELGEFMTLKLYGDENKVEFSRGWYDIFIVTFRPQTIGVKLHKTDKSTKEAKTISKSLPLDQPNLLDTLLDLL